MPELRKHDFLDEYVLIATERAKRPTDFRKPRPPAAGPETCPFCPGREERTPPAVAAYVRRGEKIELLADGEERVRGWSARVFPNLFPAVGPEHGAHEVIAETPAHDRHPSRLDDGEAVLLLRVFRDRFLHHTARGARYVSLFRNHRPEAGASLSHPHSQLISLPLVPPKMAAEQRALARECALCRVAPEEARGGRFLLRRGAWVAFAPRASRKPFEAWVVPERHLPSLREVEGSDLRDFALLARDLLARIEGVLGDFPYNAMLFQLGEGDYHLSLRVEPELATAAGFEKSTGVYINPLPPEEAARTLRSEARGGAEEGPPAGARRAASK
ncbi:MAG: sulfate adenylyltransferase [Halobacteria archaeon]